MSLWPVTCAYCGKSSLRLTGEVNRAEKAGRVMFCNKTCFGLSRRVPDERTPEQKKADKAEYDRKYREENRAWRKAQKAEYHKQNYDPEKAREIRKAKMPRHVEYCRRPEYRAKKSAYDRRRLAQEHYGPFAEAALVLRDIETEVLSRATRYEIDQQNERLNKATKRKRDYARNTGIPDCR